MMKEKEKEELMMMDKKHREMCKQYSDERNAQREKFAKELDRQIQERLHEQSQQRSAEKEAELKMLVRKGVAGPDVCPHGKKYACAYCQRSYPRACLSKRPMKDHC